jgi:hypothetical protein
VLVRLHARHRNVCGGCLRRNSTGEEGGTVQGKRVVRRACELPVTRRSCLCEQGVRGVWYASLAEDARRVGSSSCDGIQMMVLSQASFCQRAWGSGLASL